MDYLLNHCLRNLFDHFIEFKLEIINRIFQIMLYIAYFLNSGV